MSADFDFWNAARLAVLKALALGDPIGLRRAIERRAIVVWLREASEKIDLSGTGLPWQAIEAVKLDFRVLLESDVGASGIYERAEAWIADGTLQVH